MSLCKRIIGTILIDNGLVVRRVGFKTSAIVGRPEVTIKFLNNWNVDEVMFINVGEKRDISEVLMLAARNCFVPITVGGNISSLEEVQHYMNTGADKVVIGKHATRPLIDQIAAKLGSQAVSVSIDEDHKNKAKIMSRWGMGELIMHDASRDGKGEGVNLNILKHDTELPIIAMGGVGNYQHIVEGLKHADGVAVGNLLHFKEMSVIESKKEAVKLGLDIRL